MLDMRVPGFRRRRSFTRACGAPWCPHMVARDRQDLIRNLIELTNQRHGKYGHTIFHLEPNLLRMHRAACATSTFAGGLHASRSWA